MAIFTIDKFGGADVVARADYFERGEGQVLCDALELRSGREDYYHQPGTDTLVCEFVGSGCAVLDLGIAPQDGDYAALMAGYNPRTGESFVPSVRRGQLDKGAANAGFSTSFNADKSISLVYASLPREQQIVIERAMIEAARRSIQHMEGRGYFAYRTGAGGTEQHPGRVMAATYLHFTNRNREPHLHVHAEFPNLCLGSDGKWRTLDGAELYRRQGEFAALFDCYIADAIRRDFLELGNLLEADVQKSGLRVAGVSRETILEFSSRRIEVLKGLAEMGASGPEAARSVAKRTREGKKEINSEELREQWKAQLADLHRELRAGCLTPETRLVAEQLVLKNSSVFKEYALDRAAAQLAILHGGVESIPVIRAALVQQLGIIELPREEGQPQEYTTEAYRQMEGELLAWSLQSQQPAPQFALNRLHVESAISQFEAEKGFSMRDEQREAVLHCAGGQRLQILQGAAGTGKSASLTALRIAYEGAGHRVIGLAPSGAAAAELENSAGIQSRTIHSLLMRLEHDNPRYRETLSVQDVIVCDEAGLADLRTLHKLASHVEGAGAKLVLVGDSRQLEAVGSASCLEMLTEYVGCAELIQIARQRTAEDRVISQAWFAGPAEQGGPDAPEMMLKRGLIRSPGKDGGQAFDMMLSDVVQAHEAGTDWSQILLLADRNAQVKSLNGQIREHRKQLGELDNQAEIRIPVEYASGDFGDLDLCASDRIMLRRNGKLGQSEEPVYNGDRATITALRRFEVAQADDGEPIYDTQISARLDRTGETVTWNVGDYSYLDHAYAMTVHKSQGLTVDRAFYIVSESSDRRLAYVAATRSREACPFYLDDDQSLHDAFFRNTADFQSKKTALDADPVTKQLILSAAERGIHPNNPFQHAQPSTKNLLEKAGDRFEYPAEPPQPPKRVPDIHVMPASADERAVAQARGYAVTELIDKPADTRRTPGKPYELPGGPEKVALLAEPMTPPPEIKLEAHASANTEEHTHDRQPAATDRRSPADSGIVQRSDAASLGRFDRRPDAANDKGPFSSHIPLENPQRAIGASPSDGLRKLSACRLASDERGRRKSLLQGDARPRGRSSNGVRWQDDSAGLTHKEETRAMGKSNRKVWTRDKQQEETQAIRESVDLLAHADWLGYEKASGAGARIRMVNKSLDKSDPMREITIKPNARGEPSWVSVKGGAGSGLGGDVFHLHQRATGKNFLQTRDELRALAFGSTSSQPGLHRPFDDSTRAVRAAEAAKREAEQEEIRRGIAYVRYKQTSSAPNAFLKSRGISEQTLAETKCRTDRYGNAVFVHERADGKFTGYERKKNGPPLYSKSQRGIYVANPQVESPTEIQVAEGGLDALSLYQIASRGERACTLYVSSAGNPAADTAKAIAGLAQRRHIEQVSFAYDRDSAGDSHTETLRKLLAEHAPHLKTRDVRGELDLREGEDPNDLLKRIHAKPTERPQATDPLQVEAKSIDQQLQQLDSQAQLDQQGQDPETFSRERSM